MFHVEQFVMKASFSHCPVCNSARIENVLDTNDFFLTKENFSIFHCNDCGINFTNPRPSSDIIGEYYKSEEYFSHNDSKKSLTSGIYYLVRKINLKLKFQIVKRNSQGKSLLDIGCGTGEFLNYCKSNGKVVRGVEPGEGARNFARSAYSIDVSASLQEIVAIERFDVVTMWHSLEHIADLHGTIARIRELLKENGLLLIAVPNFKSWDALHYGLFWAGYDVPRHLYHFSKESLAGLLQGYGFSLINTIPQQFDAFYVSLLSERYKRGKTGYLKAFINGLRSNYQAGRGTNGYSSQIYLFKRTEAQSNFNNV